MFGRKRQNDGELVRRVMSGQQEDFDILVERYLPMVHAIAYAQTGNREDALDVAQEAFLKAFRSLDTLREPARFKSWLLTIARNAGVSLVRSRQRHREALDEVAPHTRAYSPDFGGRELRAMLRGQVMAMDPIHREILLLFYFSGLNISEIAASLDISKNAVKKRLYRARKALSSNLINQMHDVFEDERPRKSDARAIAATVASATAPWKTALGTGATVLTAGTGTVAGISAVSMAGLGVAAVTVMAAGVWAVGHYTSKGLQEPPSSETAVTDSADPTSARLHPIDAGGVVLADPDDSPPVNVLTPTPVHRNVIVPSSAPAVERFGPVPAALDGLPAITSGEASVYCPPEFASLEAQGPPTYSTADSTPEKGSGAGSSASDKGGKAPLPEGAPAKASPVQ